jgi:hypothetical protein
MKYLETKEGSLEEAISQAINEKKLDPVGKEDGDIDNDGDKDDSDRYLAKRRKAITKAIKKQDQKEELDKDDEKTRQKVIDKLKKASKAHADQSKSLEKDLQDDVDKTIDTIQQANDSKRQSMRSILADIWKVNEGKSPFEKEPMSFEGFASDAQRRAAFASGYKEKGKKKKEEVEDPIKKTLTGKKPTKVEVEPKIK